MKKSVVDRKHTKKRSITAIILAVCIMVLACVSVVYYYSHTIVKPGSVPDVNLLSMAYQIDSAEVENGKLDVAGWFFEMNTPGKTGFFPPHARLILADMEDYGKSRYYKVNTGRPAAEADQYFAEETDHSGCGFDASIRLSDEQLKKDQEILIQPDEWDDRVIRTGCYLHDGQVVYGSPDYAAPDTAGTDLEEVTENGRLRACWKEQGAYIYQYGWKLYYLADSRIFPKDGLGGFALKVFTDHPELLPEEFREDSVRQLSVSFEEGIQQGDYYVTVAELPQDIPVMSVDTGYWTSQDGWVWHVTFCPGIPE